MASKYDFFWRSKIKDISVLLDKAYYGHEGHSLDVAGIKSLGERGNWYGVVDVCKDNVSKGKMAHAKSLGNIIKDSRLLKSYGDSRFTLTISADCKLTAIKTSMDSNIQSKPAVVKNRTVKTKYNKERIEALIEILSDVPWESWVKIVEEEPEWHNMEHFNSKYGFGSFAVLMIVTGLNDFQLKGKAEVAYWVPIKKIFDSIPKLNEPRDIFHALVPFYKKERYDELKIKRMRKFLKSDLVSVLWTSTPDHAVKIFPYVWKELAKTMGQEPSAKTISFAMKCFGVALLIAGKSDFDFTHIPIPVDYRVEVFTKKTGISKSKDADHIREIWYEVLKGIQKKEKQVAMLHLDSLVWQIGVLYGEGIKSYFKKVGTIEIGHRLNAYIEGRNHILKFNGGIQPKLLHKSKAINEKVICFIPCCKSKNATGDIINPLQALSEGHLSRTWRNLISGRKNMEYCIDKNSQITTAFNLYIGKFYNELAKNTIIEKALKGEFELIIITAGYGIINALEPIHDYDAVMSGKVLKQWRDIGLAESIADYLIHQQPKKVYGFFAGEEYWSNSSSKYRYLFTEGVRKAIENGLNAHVGCFYREDGRGSGPILSALGNIFDEFVSLDFDQVYVEKLENEGKAIGNINVGFRKIKF